MKHGPDLMQAAAVQAAQAAINNVPDLSQVAKMVETADAGEPLGEYVIVQPCNRIKQTAQGVYLPEDGKRQDKAVVLALSARVTSCQPCGGIGTQKHEGVVMPCQCCHPSEVQRRVGVGDTVMCSKMFTFEIDGKTAFVVREADVISIVKKAGTA